jgi:hypothetical protein
MAKCLVYYDEKRATSWISDAAGKALADELEKKGFSRVDAGKLRQELKNAVNNNAKEYIIVFTRDVIPHDIFDIFEKISVQTPGGIINIDIPKPDIAKPPIDTLLMKFLIKGGNVIWLGDVPFWYVTNPINGSEKVGVWQRAYFFTMLGTMQIFSVDPQPTYPVCTELCGIKLDTWYSERPVLVPPDIKVECGDLKNTLKKCMDESGFIPLVKTHVVYGFVNPSLIQIPEKGSVNLLELLSKRYQVTTITRSKTEARVSARAPPVMEAGVAYGMEEAMQRLLSIIPEAPIYFEAHAAWIRCLGKGMFIRLWDTYINEDSEARRIAEAITSEIINKIFRVECQG